MAEKKNRGVDNAEMKKPSSVYLYYNDISRFLSCNGVTRYFDTVFPFVICILLYCIITILFTHSKKLYDKGNRKKMYA